MNADQDATDAEPMCYSGDARLILAETADSSPAERRPASKARPAGPVPLPSPHRLAGSPLARGVSRVLVEPGGGMGVKISAPFRRLSPRPCFFYRRKMAFEVKMGSWPADKVERRPVAGLVPYARNARQHTDAQVAQIAASIREWGWTNPVLLDEDSGIIAGHGRVLAAYLLGIADIPVMVARGWSEASPCLSGIWCQPQASFRRCRSRRGSTAHLDAGGGDLVAAMPAINYQRLLALDAVKPRGK